MSQERTFFPELKLFKKTIIERLLMSLYHIYREHPIYAYKDIDLDTKILIHSSYAKVDTPNKIPRIAIKVNGYTFSFTDYLFDEISNERVNENGVVTGWEYEKILSTTVTMVVQSFAEEETTNISDELAMLLSFSAKDFFRSAGLIVRGVQVSETEIANKEQGIFQTMIGVSLEIPWKAFIENKNAPVFDGTIFLTKDTILKDVLPTDQELHVLDSSVFYVNQIVQVTDWKTKNKEWMQIKEKSANFNKLKVLRGLFESIPIAISYGSRMNGYETSVTSSALDSSTSKLMLSVDYQNFFKIGTIIYIAPNLNFPFTDLEMARINKKSMSTPNVIFLLRGVEGSNSVIAPVNTVVFQTRAKDSSERGPGVNVYR
jgi:hypothetical protein